MTWSNWLEIDQPAGHTGCAVYKIRLAKDHKAATIPRFLDADIAGLLCIGQTSKFEQRRRKFSRGLKSGKEHSEARLLYLLENLTPLKSKYQGYEYEYSFQECESDEEAKALEERLIKLYIKQFGEPPPLNSAIPRRYAHDGWTT